MYFHIAYRTLSGDRTDHDSWTNQKLGVNTKRIHVAGELEEQWSSDSCSWRGRHGDGGVGLVEQGVVEREDAVANGEDFSCHCGDLWPAIQLLWMAVW